MSIDSRDQVLKILGSVPEGAVVSYGQVADMAGLGSGARQVGRILKMLPEGTKIPWHRVVNASGYISVSGPSKARQISQLNQENVPVIGGRVDMKRYRWDPSAQT
jgi:methylated-DNA-protein-cysteine methyltransferase related protein